MTKSNGTKGSSNLPAKTGGQLADHTAQKLNLIGQGVDAVADVSKNISNAYVAKQAHESIKSQSQVNIRDIEESNKTTRLESEHNLKTHQANVHENISKINQEAQQNKYEHKQKIKGLDNEKYKIKKEHEKRMLEIQNQNQNQNQKQSSIKLLEEDYRLLRIQLSSDSLTEGQKSELLKEMKDIREKIVSLYK